MGVVLAVHACRHQVGVTVMVGQQLPQPRQQLLVVAASVDVQDLDPCRCGALVDLGDQAVLDRQSQIVAVRAVADTMRDQRDGDLQSTPWSRVADDIAEVADVADVIHDDGAAGDNLAVAVAEGCPATRRGVVLVAPHDVRGQQLLEVADAARGQQRPQRRGHGPDLGCRVAHRAPPLPLPPGSPLESGTGETRVGDETSVDAGCVRWEEQVRQTVDVPGQPVPAEQGSVRQVDVDVGVFLATSHHLATPRQPVAQTPVTRSGRRDRTGFRGVRVNMVDDPSSARPACPMTVG